MNELRTASYRFKSYGLLNGIMNYKIVIAFLLLALPLITTGQIYNSNRQPPYLRVFVDTDDFDASYLDSLQQTVQFVTDDSLQLVLITDLAYYWHTRNLKKATKITQEAIANPQIEKYPILKGRLQIVQAAILLRDEQLDLAESILRQAKPYVSKTDLPFFYTQLSYVMERRGLIGKASVEVRNALQIGEEINDTHAIAQAYSDLSYLFWKQSKYTEALDLGLQSEQYFQKWGLQDLDYNFTLYLIGVYLLSLEEYEQAISYFERAITMAKYYGFYNNLSDIYISLTDLYTEIERYDLAESNSLLAIKYAQLLNNNFLLMRSWLSVGRSQNFQQKYSSAITSLETSLKIATQQFGDEFYLNQVYQELGTAQAGLGNYQAAYTAFLTYDELKDNIFTNEANQRIAQLQTEFEVLQKETTIANQQKTLQQQKRLQILTASLLFLVSIIFLILYISYQKNRKNNKKLTQLNNNLSEKNTLLDQRIAENEILAKEIHHRVKNNLQMIASLLSLQSMHINDKTAFSAIQASQKRVESVGILHKELYARDNITNINMLDYLPILTSNLEDAFITEDRIQIKHDISSIEMDVETAIPVGLIVNELVTNALKYAFPNDTEGTIRVSLKKPEANKYLLEISDNGIGHTVQNNDDGTNFGTKLVEILTQQLNATYQKQSDEKGYRVSLEWG